MLRGLWRWCADCDCRCRLSWVVGRTAHPTLTAQPTIAAQPSLAQLHTIPILSQMEVPRELEAAYSQAESIARECVENLYDALFESNPDWRAGFLETAQAKYRKLQNFTSKYPEIVFDEDNFQKHIDLIKSNFALARIEIQREIGFNEFNDLRMGYHARHDYLGKAAGYRAEAEKHKIAGDGDKFWRANERVKTCYIAHTNKNAFTREQAMALVTSTFKESADFLRLEGAHKEALRHYLYFLAHQNPTTATSIKRLRAFLKRAGIPKEFSNRAIECLDESQPLDDFEAIDRFIREASRSD